MSENLYSDKLKSIQAPTFKKIKDIACSFINCLPVEKRNSLYDQLKRGVNLLDTHELMCQYLWSYGNMHEAKIKKSLSCFSKSDFEKEITVIDWGCGQGLATVCFFDFLKSVNAFEKVKSSILIEPSKKALDRAFSHVNLYLKDVSSIKTVNKFLDEIIPDDISSVKKQSVFHFFSNILDIAEIDLKNLANNLKQNVYNDNYVVCVGPLNPGNLRIDAFYEYFDSPETFLNEKESQFYYGSKSPCSYNIRVYKLTADTEGILIPVEFYPSVQFNAAYQLDFIKESFSKISSVKKEKVRNLYKSISAFDVSAPFDIGASIYDDVNPVLAVLNNIVTRGLPTKSSPFIERVFSKTHNFCKEDTTDGVLSYKQQAATLDVNDIFLALHLIDSRLSLNKENYSSKKIESDFELNYILSSTSESIRQLLLPQRSLSSITRNFRLHHSKRVDFSFDSPYRDTNEKSGVVIEIDGERYHKGKSSQIEDQNRVTTLNQLNWDCIRIAEQDSISVKTFPFKNEYLSNIDKVWNKPFNSQWTSVLEFVLTPVAIARIQKTILEALMTGKISIEQSVWRIVVIERDVPCAAIALQDLAEMFNNLAHLSTEYKHLKFPEISLEVISTPEFINSPLHLGCKPSLSAGSEQLNQKYDLIVDISVLRRSDLENLSFSAFACNNNCYFIIRSSHYMRSVRPVYTSDKILYRGLVEKDSQGRYSVIPETASLLKYFLNLIFRKTDFRPGQLPILHRALQNKSVIGLLPTGGGKSLTYQLAAILQPGVTVIVDPLRSLMKDQFDGLINLGIDNCTYINSTVASKEKEDREKRMEASQFLFVFLSPERLCIYKFRERLRNMHELHVYFSYGVIDEVHCVSEWGHDFRFSYLHLGRNLYNFVRTKHGHLSLFGLTATASFDVLADVERELSGNGAFALDADTIVRYENTNRLELQYKIERVTPAFNEDAYFDRRNNLQEGLPKAINISDKWSFYDSKKDFVKNYIKELPKHIRSLQTPETIQSIKSNFSERQEPDESINNPLTVSMPDDFYTKKEKYDHAGIVFCPHKASTGISVDENKNALSEYISDIGFFVGSSEGDNEEAAEIDRLSNENLESFRDNKQTVMVATKAFGMGIDKPNVRFTINLNYSSSLESFVQEAGRAGRDRKMALSVILLSDYKIARINKKCTVDRFPMGIIKNRWFIPEDLNEIIHHYHLDIPQEYIEVCTPEKDMVKVVCDECYRFSRNCCDRQCTYTNCRDKTASCDLPCSKLNNCSLVNFPAEAKEFIFEDDLKELLSENQLTVERKNLQYQNADYESVMYFYNNNFKGAFVEKTYMHKLLSTVKTQVFYGDDEEIKKDDLATVNGFLTSLLNSQLGTQIVSFVSYTKESNTDIAKAIYRMCCIELIEDFTQDYSNKRYRIVASRKTEGSYFNGLRNFLLRYFTAVRADEEIERAMNYPLNRISENNLENEIHKCLGYLTEFVYEKIAIKRKRAIDDMRDFCIQGIDEEKNWIERNEILKDYIYYYFNSKYAKDDYVTENGVPYSLTIDTDRGKVSSSEILFKYTEVINESVDSMSTPKDNIKHLQGAVRLIRRSHHDNATILLLNAFCLFYLGTHNNENLIKELHKSYKDGMEGFFHQYEKNTVEFWAVFEKFNKFIKENTFAEDLTSLTYDVMLSIHGDNLKKITSKYLA